MAAQRTAQGDGSQDGRLHGHGYGWHWVFLHEHPEILRRHWEHFCPERVGLMGGGPLAAGDDGRWWRT